MKLHLTSMGAKMAFSLFLIAGAMSSVNAQNVGINANGATPNASAILDVSSTDKGLLAPRMTQTQRNAITTPATGLLIFQTDNTPGFYYYNGSGWVQGVGATGAQGPAGAAGAQGTAGATGAQGAAGAAGAQGPAGATGAQGIAGTTGQNSTTYYSNGAVQISNSNGLYYAFGFPITVNVPANCKTLISYDIGVNYNSTAATVADVFILVDGGFLPRGGYQRESGIATTNASTNNTNFDIFSTTQALTLTPGNHTLGLAAYRASGGGAFVFGGADGSVLQGSLTVTFIKQ